MFGIKFWDNGQWVNKNVPAASERDARRQIPANDGPYGSSNKQVKAIPTPYGNDARNGKPAKR